MFVYGVRGHHGKSSEVESDSDEDPETMLMVVLTIISIKNRFYQ